ncbi:MAG: acyl-CoA reductase [Lewinellaceae bacterium]|nr:acyl-CoA reductase [Saprospiraceae bacterium]MCB9342377.1 acyl-CoA reductase [Lewinellaceae bacterium]
MELKERLNLLTELGQFLKSGGDEELERAILQSYQENNWFTQANVQKALDAIAHSFLDQSKLQSWVANYQIQDKGHPDKTIGLIMAGNIPLVGFHDWLCVFVSGHKARIKLSDKDKRLLPVLIKKMGEWNKESFAYTEFLFPEDKLSGFEAVIATGSNNTAKYFEQYFGKYPHIIRRNRNSVAVLNGYESKEDLMALGQDIFSYFGLGCRNVSKLYVPHGYQFDFLLETLHEYRDLVNHAKYKNNFDYNFTLYILNKIPHLNNGCILLKEDQSLQARIASLHYEYYDELADLDKLLTERKKEIQCVVGKTQLLDFEILPFGKSQEPALNDYADGVDVMKFLNTD